MFRSDCFFFFFFFFSSRRRHTRYIGDWSSDVCSSDLGARGCDSPEELVWRRRWYGRHAGVGLRQEVLNDDFLDMAVTLVKVADGRSEERRVGKECRSRWAADQEKRKDRVK